MQVARGFRANRDLPSGMNMLHSGCPARHDSPTKGYEIITLCGDEYCLNCLADAVFEQNGNAQPWFYTGSPFGAELLDAAKRAGIQPITRQPKRNAPNGESKKRSSAG